MLCIVFFNFVIANLFYSDVNQIANFTLPRDSRDFPHWSLYMEYKFEVPPVKSYCEEVFLLGFERRNLNVLSYCHGHYTRKVGRLYKIYIKMIAPRTVKIELHRVTPVSVTGFEKLQSHFSIYRWPPSCSSKKPAEITELVSWGITIDHIVWAQEHIL